MPGKRGPEFGDFVTPFEEYRSNVGVADTVDVQDSSIPVLDTRSGPNQNVIGQGSDGNQYGRNAQIGLAVVVAGCSKVELELWLNAEPTRARLSNNSPVGSSSSSSSSSSTSPTDMWVKVAEKTFGAVSELWVVKDIPPGEYKVKVVTVTGGNVSLIECHAA
jgi:hypothetical protein